MAILIVYLIMSVITFCVYGLDKFKAQKRMWRVPEKMLHILEFCCGWPGALLAQHFLRHKTCKKNFRIVFWMMVVLNVGMVCLVKRIAL